MFPVSWRIEFSENSENTGQAVMVTLQAKYIPKETARTPTNPWAGFRQVVSRWANILNGTLITVLMSNMPPMDPKPNTTM